MTTASEASTLLDLVRVRALESPSLRAYSFLVDGETAELTLTYSELDLRSRSVAALLQSKGLQGGQVLLIFPPGLEYIVAFFACLYAGVVAVPAYPPQVMLTLSRLQGIVADAGTTVGLTTLALRTTLQRMCTHVEGLSKMQWLTTDDIAPCMEEQWHEPALNEQSLAFLQYTSGTTGAAKGVMLSHGNVLHNLALLLEGERGVAYGSKSGSLFSASSERGVGALWLPPYHDLGLIGGILLPVYAGTQILLMSPFSFLEHPLRWLRAISRFRAGYSGAPDFAYDWCVSRISPEQRAGLDLSCWHLALCGGGGTVRHEALERFAVAFADCGFRREAFYVAYGLAEATLFVSGRLKPAVPVVKVFDRRALERHQVLEGSVESQGARALVGCGGTLLDQELAVVEPNTMTRCSPGRVGEIWVSGPSVGQGYWRHPAETEATFNAHLADTGEGPFLRTGDLGFLKNDELFVTGRLKDLIVIQDRFLYPEDIEMTVEKCHNALRPYSGAAFVVDFEKEKGLVILQEVDRDYKLDLNSVVEVIRETLAVIHQIQPYAVMLIRAGSIFRTSSGKIQRFACRKAFLAGKLKVVAKWRAS
jgi:acyl-CoA synthetase (AMP-forming)/AMP-acid ligase II